MSSQLLEAAVEIRQRFHDHKCEVSERLPERLSIHLGPILGIIAVVPKGYAAYVSDGSKDLIRGVSDQFEVNCSVPTLSEATSLVIEAIERLLDDDKQV